MELGIYKPTMKDKIKFAVLRGKHKAVEHWRSACDWLKWIGHKPCNLERYAEDELRLAGWFSPDAIYGDMMGKAVLKLVREFSAEGHSGMSAGIATGILKELLMFRPLTPLTGEAEEWTECGTGVFQNKRCSHVFMENGKAYDIEGRIFREPNGAAYTNWDSRVPVAFPYTPKSEIIDVGADDAD